MKRVWPTGGTGGSARIVHRTDCGRRSDPCLAAIRRSHVAGPSSGGDGGIGRGRRFGLLTREHVGTGLGKGTGPTLLLVGRGIQAVVGRRDVTHRGTSTFTFRGGQPRGILRRSGGRLGWWPARFCSGILVGSKLAEDGASTGGEVLLGGVHL